MSEYGAKAITVDGRISGPGRVRKSWLLRVYPIIPPSVLMPWQCPMAILTQCLSPLSLSPTYACPFLPPRLTQPHFLLRSGNKQFSAVIVLFCVHTFSHSSSYLLFSSYFLYFKSLFFLSSHRCTKTTFFTDLFFILQATHIIYCSYIFLWYKQGRKFLQIIW